MKQRVHIIPIGNQEPLHQASLECWCHPLEKEGVVIHNAKDCREKLERQGVSGAGGPWCLICEKQTESFAWVSCEEKTPNVGERVLVKYKGVYGPRVVTYWCDGVNHHFGNPPESNPITHWCRIPE